MIKYTLALLLSLLLLFVAPLHAEQIDGAVTDHLIAPSRAEAPRTCSAYGASDPRLFHNANYVQIPPPDVAKLVEEDARRSGPGPLRNGVVLDVGLEITNTGQWTKMKDGNSLWTMTVVAPGAEAIRLLFDVWSLPHGAELLVYDTTDPTQCFSSTRTPRIGRRTRAGGYNTRILFSSSVNIEYHVPLGSDDQENRLGFSLDHLVYFYKEITVAPSALPEELTCHLDVNCYPAWSAEKEGIVALTWMQGGSSFFCSGAMINRVPGDLTPIIMTANHCGVQDANVDTLWVTWRYETTDPVTGAPLCGGTPADPATLPQTPGVVALVNDPTSDWCLIGMTSDHPGGVSFLGWDASFWPDDSDATGIHHPSGTHKRISFGTKTRSDELCWYGASMWTVEWPQGSGLAEPGSSGSPVFDSAKRVRGTMTGCGTEACSTANIIKYGRLDTAWGQVEPYLDPTDPVYVDGSYAGAERGTSSQPFNRVIEAVYAVISSSSVHIEAGSYNEQMLVDKPMVLRARNGTVTIGR